VRQSRPSLDARKERIRSHLEQYVADHFPGEDVAVLLSGGADSTVVALAAHHAGKKITAFSFEVLGCPNPDFRQAERTCEIMGWSFEPVEVSTENLPNRFLDLFFEYGCAKKTEAECLFPLLDVIQRVRARGFPKVLTGFGSFLPDDRRSAIECSNDPAGYWESCRREAGIGDSSATVKIIEIAAAQGLEILMPLCHRNVVDALSGLNLKEMMGSPYPKHHYKDLYFDDFSKLGLLGVESRNLQAAGDIERVFTPLLAHPVIGEGGARSGDPKRRLSTLCVRWGRAAKNGTVARPNVADEFVALPPAEYRPYLMADVMRASAKRLFTVVSTFAGGGGSSTGYRLAGGWVAFVNEFVGAAIETYRLNYPDTPVVSKDIRGLNRGREAVQRLFAQHGIGKGELDIFDGSPPCATFSRATAGRGKEKMAKKNAGYSDTKQSRIGYLIHDYVFMANAVQPKVCVMENVPGIVKSEVFHAALERLRRWGYLVAYKKLVSSDYGVPQRRQRLFVIAVRPDVARRAGIVSENDVAAVFPRPSSGAVTIRQALAGLAVDRSERDMLLTATRQSAAYELVKTLPFDPPKHTRMRDVAADWTSDFSLTRAAWDLPCPTITATGAQGRGGIYHPEENRGFTIAELKRLTGLPDDFKLSGTFSQKAERIGRMVPPLMTKAISELVYETILRLL
jgi:DNA (cytosine-5)-methyltransferase 1